MDERDLWGIWCVELSAWCRNEDLGPVTLSDESSAQAAAAHWKRENEYYVARGLQPARLGCDPADVLVDDAGRMMPMSYEARRYPGDRRVDPAAAS